MQKTAIFRLSLRASLGLLFLGSSACLAAAQAPLPLPPAGSALISPRRVLIKRNAKLAREFPDRKTAVVRYPVVTALANPQALQKLQSTLAVKNVFGITLSEYREDAWLTEFDYKVGYNKNYLLDVTFTQSGMGAYPDTQNKHFIINLKTGTVIKAAEAFDKRLSPKLVQLIDAKLQSEIREIIKGLASDKELSNDERESLKSTFSELRFTEENLDEFEVSNTGIAFLFDAGFPHVIQALQPDGRYFFSFAALKNYIRNDGPLAILLSGK
jgi:hypothetical protein